MDVCLYVAVFPLKTQIVVYLLVQGFRIDRKGFTLTFRTLIELQTGRIIFGFQARSNIPAHHFYTVL